MRINNNIAAMNTHRQYGINNSQISKSTEKLSSGFRINRAGDDAAGLAISEKMRAQIRGLQMASKNSQDAISLVQTAEGALQETHNILQRMRELAVQSASDSNETSVDRAALQAEFRQLQYEIDDTASKTKFNDMGIIDGTFSVSSKAFYVQTGANAGDFLAITIGNMNTKILGVAAGAASATGGTPTVGEGEDVEDVEGGEGAASAAPVNISTRIQASAAIKAVNNAINLVSTQRAKLGALQNRLQHKINNLDTSAENLSAAESRIRDIDMAKEMTNYTRWNILSQASTAMLAQANQAPQGVLQLLG